MLANKITIDYKVHFLNHLHSLIHFIGFEKKFLNAKRIFEFRQTRGSRKLTEITLNLV
jgi:hypothetical protein